MERFSIIFSLCSLTILAESIPIESSTIETLWDNAHGVRNIENHDLLKPTNVQDNTKQLLLDENLMENTTQGEEHAKNSLHLNETSVTSVISTGDFLSSYINDTQHLKYNESQEVANHEKEPSADLSSHDILLDPDLILVRLNRQTKRSNTDYSKPASVENISRDVESNNDENRSIVTLKQNSNPEGDLSVAEDRYQAPNPYWNPHYRGQFPNQRYRTNDRREPYRNYWRYPVFPGK